MTCAYVESPIPYFQLKLLKIFKIQTNYKYFSYKCFTFQVNIYLSLPINVYMSKLSVCCK